MANNSRSTWSQQHKLEWFQKQFRPHFDEWVVAPAQRIIDMPEGMPAFIWLTCAIDWLAGFWWGEPTKKEGNKPYVGFIDEFFPSNTYIAGNLYDSLRNGLIHMYTIKKRKYALTNQNPQWHLKIEDGQQIINLENFFEDFVNAKERFFNAMEDDPTLLDKLIIRYERDGFLGLIPINLP